MLYLFKHLRYFFGVHVCGSHTRNTSMQRGSGETLGAGVKTIRKQVLLFSRNQAIYFLAVVPVSIYLVIDTHEHLLEMERRCLQLRKRV